MKRIVLSAIILLSAIAAFAQTDTTGKNSGDTVFVGNFIIIRNHKPAYTNEDSIPPKRKNYTIINMSRRRIYTGQTSASKTFSTNYLILDLGFANYNDRTDYNSDGAQQYAPGLEQSDLKLVTGKSSNVNIWLFMQKLNVASRIVNLKYGLGLNMYNYRFKNDISITNDDHFYKDTIRFSKDKLYVGYATIPLMLNLNATPNLKHGLSISAGVSAGYRIGSHLKQISDEHGKIKDHNDFNLNDWKLSYVAELGLGPVHLYGSYSINTLFKDGIKQYPFAIGLRFSN